MLVTPSPTCYVSGLPQALSLFGKKRHAFVLSNVSIPQNSIQSPNRLYKAPTDSTKPRKDYANT